MQPLMNMITFTARSRAEIVALHSAILEALQRRDGAGASTQLERLEAYTKTLAHTVIAAREGNRAENHAAGQIAGRPGRL